MAHVTIEDAGGGGSGKVYVVLYDDTPVYKSPDSKSAIKGSKKKNDEVTVTDSRGGYYKISGGWIPQSYVTRKVKEVEVSSSTKNTKKEDEDDGGSGYRPDIESILSYDPSSLNTDKIFRNINSITGIFGLPYQFLPNCDPRINESNGQDIVSNSSGMGYEYAEKIVSQLPLLLIAPGKANFMTQYSKEQKQTLLEWLITKSTSGMESFSLDDLGLETGRYYTFEYDTERYYTYVNPMCRAAAIYLGIQNVEIPYTSNGGVRALRNFDWAEYTATRLNDLGDIATFSSIPFYVESDSSISESFSNSTTQSMIASTVNSISDMGRELNFLMGYGAGMDGLDKIMQDEAVMSSVQNVQDIISGILGKGNMLSNLASHLTTVASGGKLIFPEIWAESQYSRSYNCEFKFISPDPSPLGIYLNVLVPLFHLIGLVAPQSMDANPNGYTQPFLIRAIYKGLFNVDMGIITDMSVTKGAEGQWTPNGLPTSVTVSITIKDLYNNLTITPTSNKDLKYDTLNNTALMDYIAGMCGINIFKPEVTRMIEMWWMLNVENRILDIPSNIWGSITQKVQNALVNNIY